MTTSENQASNETMKMIMQLANKLEELQKPLDEYKKEKIAKIKKVLGVEIKSDNLTIICSSLFKSSFNHYFSDVVKVHEDKNLKGYAYIVFDNSISELKTKQEIQVSDENTSRVYLIDLERQYKNLA
jgi:N-acetylneuraminic acid mutarotase